MKKFKLSIFLMILAMLFVTGCEDESTTPDTYTNGMLITLGTRNFDARNSVNCSKDNNNIVTFTCEDSDENNWQVAFLWGANSQNGDTIFISDSRYNEITLDSPMDPDIANYYIEYSQLNASETFIRVIEYVDGVKIEAEIEGSIYETGSSTSDSLKNGYFTTTNFN